MTIDKQSSFRKKACWLVASVAVGGVAVQPVLAAEPQGMQLGPGYFYPNAGLNVYYDDNLLSQKDDPIDSMVTVVSASGREEIYGDVSRYALEAGLDKAWYHSSADDNYLDGRVFGEAAFYPSSRVSASAKGGYWREHEDRGTTTLQGDLASLQENPDTYDLWAIEGNVGYGLEEVGATKFELMAAYQNREYTNNRLLTQFRDRDEATLEATFKYMIMPATSLLLEGRYKDFDYKRDEAQLDSNEYRLRAGVTWEATAATTGFAKIGWQEKNFDSDLREDGDKPAWDVGVEWSPLTYSTFGLNTQRKFDESTGVGDFIDRRETRISWRHAWRQYVSSNLYYSAGRDNYNGSSREDDVSGFGLSVDYAMRAYLDWSLYYRYQDRDSNVPDLDYDRNQFGLQAKFAL